MESSFFLPYAISDGNPKTCTEAGWKENIPSNAIKVSHILISELKCIINALLYPVHCL